MGMNIWPMSATHGRNNRSAWVGNDKGHSYALGELAVVLSHEFVSESGFWLPQDSSQCYQQLISIGVQEISPHNINLKALRT